MVISVASITIVLTHVRTLFDLNLRLAEKQKTSTRLLNKIAAFKLIQIQKSEITEIDDFTLNLTLEDDYNPQLYVKNFTQLDEKDIPIVTSYTPYQEYTLFLDPSIIQHGEQISFILKGLTPPE